MVDFDLFFSDYAISQLVLYGTLGVVISVWVWISLDRQRRERWPKEGRCAACGYDLRGSSHAMICPECGMPFEIRRKIPLITHPFRGVERQKDSG